LTHWLLGYYGATEGDRSPPDRQAKAADAAAPIASVLS
jgi:hypothetical protein